ncbi:MAG: cysteine desulfurase [Acidimicrobiia bacterium]
MDRVAYLDHAATTPLRPEARAAMARLLTDDLGNPSGSHSVARRAKTALEEAREAVGGDLGSAPGEVVFTGGGTEGDNLAVLGAARAARRAGKGSRVIVTAIEHKAVLAAGARLAADGFDVRVVGATPAGLVDLVDLERALDPDTVLVSTMLVNNEVGTVQPLARVAELVRARAPHAVLHTDAVQGAPWLDLGATTREADLVSISAHKLGGPTGVGALVVRRGVELEPVLVGGGQERGLRSGTVNVPGAVGLAAALRATIEHRDEEVTRARHLRDRLAAGLAQVEGVVENGDRARAVPGNHHVRIEGVDAETLLVALDRAGVCAAAGSSCASGAAEPSHVLVAMGLTRAEARSAVRFSLGHTSRDEDVDRVLAVLPGIVARIRDADRAPVSAA